MKDVSHEFGCTWTAGRRDHRARLGLRAADHPGPGHRPGALRARPGVRQGPAARFGRPSLASRCRTSEGVERGYRGLFGDAWLSCTLLGPGRKEPADLSARADHWCAAVATAAAS